MDNRPQLRTGYSMIKQSRITLKSRANERVTRGRMDPGLRRNAVIYTLADPQVSNAFAGAAAGSARPTHTPARTHARTHAQCCQPPPPARLNSSFMEVHTRGSFARPPITFVYFDCHPITFVVCLSVCLFQRGFSSINVRPWNGINHHAWCVYCIPVCIHTWQPVLNRLFCRARRMNE